MPITPYVVGQWVRGQKFYGRASLVEEILEGYRSWVWILGTRRIGKTSLLKQIELLTSSDPDSKYFPIFWDFQGAEDADELHRSFSDALLDAEDRLTDREIDPEKLQGRDLLASMGLLRRKLRSIDLTLLLLCDEVEELIKLNRNNPNLLPRLRKAMQGEDIRSVLASTIRLWALADQQVDTSPFLHGFTPPLYIHGMSDEEARALVRQEQLPDASRPSIDDQTVEEIRRHCDNHPYLIQLVAKAYLYLGDLQEAIENVGAEQMVSHFFAVDFEMLSQPERDVVRIIAEQSSANSDSILDKIALDPGELSGILLRLEHLGYVGRHADRRFVLRNYFFRKWFLEQPHSRLPMPATSPVVSSVRPPSEQSTVSDETNVGLFDGRYELREQLGRGGTGVVYKAYDVLLKEQIAIKILKPEFASNADLLERLRREILLSREIGHPNIPLVHYLGSCHGQWYLAMKFIDGPTLAKVIADQGALPTQRTAQIGAKIAFALEAAHAQKVIHRDIKPQNILLDKQGEPYLTDFGLARLLTAPGMTRSGVFLGTPDYASPEQAGLKPTDERSDLYSLGVVLFELATGKKPFIADSSRRILEMHCDEPPPDPQSLRPSIPADLKKVILQSLEKNPDRRYQSARALRRALDEVEHS
jgi:hypothetical protein